MKENNEQITGAEEQDVSMSRRALIKAGWAVPVVLAALTPANVFAHGNYDAGEAREEEGEEE